MHKRECPSNSVQANFGHMRNFKWTHDDVAEQLN